jgi:protein-S-isoprenylcysteine O-methyltransferase Ste14
VLSVHTVTGSTGWVAPTWLVAVVAALAVLGLGGVLWSERALRRRRKSDDLELKGA